MVSSFRTRWFAHPIGGCDGKLLQVVGHTPVEKITREGNLISCDVFSTDRDRKPIGTQEYLMIGAVIIKRLCAKSRI